MTPAKPLAAADYEGILMLELPLVSIVMFKCFIPVKIKVKLLRSDLLIPVA